MDLEAGILNYIKSQTGLPERSIVNTLNLLDQGATIPFISRYRKEMTGSLDEVAVASVESSYSQLKELNSRRNYIIGAIQAQGKLSDGLKIEIQNTWNLSVLEDLYLPYKRKKSTKATRAREEGLENLALSIFKSKTTNPRHAAKSFLNKAIKNTTQALEGARFIIAEIVSEHKVAREITRDIFLKTARLNCKLIKSREKEAEKYKNYFEFNQALQKIPSHRLLAIFRGEAEKLLRVKIEIDTRRLESRLIRYFVRHGSESADQVILAIRDSLKRLILPSISNEFRRDAKSKADDEAIDVFSENLKQLLLAAPLGEKIVLALDPGFRSGCKLAVLDREGNFITSSTIYPHPPQARMDNARHVVEGLLEQYNVEAIAIGNGTAGKESFKWLAGIISSKLECYLVNESGASIYSASEAARTEFPHLDLTVRGSISIGRRLKDPLAELVKIDPKSIGVGQYQHDVNQNKLKNKLDQVVVNCVNKVGVNLNTASVHLLSYVSGLGPTLANNIVQYRTENERISSRKELLKIPRMGAKAYEQSAGFLRIKNARHLLDSTGVHPESYELVEKMARSIGKSLTELIRNNELISKIQIRNFITDRVGLPTLNDIIEELRKPGLDPRGAAEVFHFSEGINSITDLSVGNTVNGVINNLTKFGAFVDIGIKESGLIHISQISNKFISDPSEILSLGQQVEALILDVDVLRKRISLSLKF